MYSSISQKNNNTIVFIDIFKKKEAWIPFKVYSENLISCSNQDYGSIILKS